MWTAWIVPGNGYMMSSSSMIYVTQRSGMKQITTHVET